MREILFEYGFKSVNGIVKKVYALSEVPNISKKCDVWNVLPVVYVRQFTGSTDKDGAKIFNGDIIELSKRTVRGKHFYADKPKVFKAGDRFVVVFGGAGIQLRTIEDYKAHVRACDTKFSPNGYRKETYIDHYDFWNHQRMFEVVGNIHDKNKP